MFGICKIFCIRIKMKTIISSIMLGLIVFVGNAQTSPDTLSVRKTTVFNQKSDSLMSRIDSLLMMNNSILEYIELDLSLKNRYKLYPTENIYNLLRLDTKTGRITQVQWSLKDSEEFMVTINDEDLSSFYGYGSGTFELYPTKNIYQFILLDKTDGRTWHVQWGTESKKRWIQRIY
jgi:hypothetical protein